MGTLSCFPPRYVLSELVETEKMYVDDLGQIVEVAPLSLPSPGPPAPFPLPERCLGAPLSHPLSPPYFWTSWGGGNHQDWGYILMLPSQPSHRVTWPPWLLRGSPRVFEAVTGLCLGTSSKSMSGTESEWWSPESQVLGRDDSSCSLCILASSPKRPRSVWSCRGRK